MGHRSKRVACVVAAVVVAVPLCQRRAAAQRPRIDLPEVQLDSAQGVVVGASAAVVLGSGVAFFGTKPGPGLGAFIGIRMAPVDEIRFGVAMSMHTDTVAEPESPPSFGAPETPPAMKVRSVYAEAYWSFGSGSTKLRVAPRIAWLHVTGSRIRRFSNFAVGVVFGSRYGVGDRVWIEPALALTHAAFHLSGDPRLPDTTAPGNLWQLRVDVAYRLHRPAS